MLGCEATSTELCLVPDRVRFCPLLFFFFEQTGLLTEEEAASVEGPKGVLLVTEPTSAKFGGSDVWDSLIVKLGLDPDPDPSDGFLLSFSSDLIFSLRSPIWNSDSSLWHDMHLMAALSDLICLSMAATCKICF